MKAELLHHFGDDLMVVNAARVSFGKWRDMFGEDDARLIRYLAKHEHIAPFFHPQIQFRITAPIFVARQWFRSEVGTARSPKNEISRRYVDEDPEFFIPNTWRGRPVGSVKQGSSGEILACLNADLIFANACAAAKKTYKDLLELGVAPEQARMVLPQATYTQWIETGSLHFWARLCGLRIQSDAQKETRDLAMQVSYAIARLFPVSWAALTQSTAQSK